MFQILEDEKYARYVRDMLFQYEAMYKDLPVHPQTRSYAPGKLFWQSLNDSNWLVFTSQAYDSIAEEQGQELLDDAGFSVAAAIRDGKAESFGKKSVNLSDGPDGKQGGVAIVRYGDEDLTLVYKNAAQRLSHGHYDKLSFSLFEKGDEVLQDYGLARFVNIEQKGGGNYLKENTTWAKQTIAHNTITQDETSHFEGKYEVGSQHHSELPFYFMGQVLQVNFEFDVPAPLRTLGTENGYQHLYVEGKGKPAASDMKFSWMGNNRFYTLTSARKKSDELYFTRIGSNDPDFNLRRDAALMIRRKGAKDTVFVSVVEAHGSYSPVSEFAVNLKSNIATLNVVYDDDNYTTISIDDLKGDKSVFIVSNANAAATQQHQVEIDGRALQWTGPFHYFMTE